MKNLSFRNQKAEGRSRKLKNAKISIKIARKLHIKDKKDKILQYQMLKRSKISRNINILKILHGRLVKQTI